MPPGDHVTPDPFAHVTDTVLDRHALLRYMEQGCKSREQWRIGTEHEKFGFRRSDLRPLPYAGDDGIGAILGYIADRFGWTPVLEKGLPIALNQRGASITLEPGGQLELSGAPCADIHQTREELHDHLRQLGAACQQFGVAFLCVGTQPRWSREEIPWMPKGRYRRMRDYLPTRGHLSLDMMTRTTTVQANLDFHSEADMVSKFRLAMALQPLATALFANSPFLDGRPTGFHSYRAEIWRHTDPDRCGWLPFIFEDGFGFERYVDYALATPMLFLLRHHRYEATGGAPFQLFLEGKLPHQPGIRPTMEDWATHLSTLFPDVRLKHYLEMRGADAGHTDMLCALPALWKGLLYDDQAMAEAWSLVSDWSGVERARIHAEVPRHGLATLLPEGAHGPCGGTTLLALAHRILAIADASLHRQQVLNPEQEDEAIYLQPLHVIAEQGISPSERLLRLYHGTWRGDIDRIFSSDLTTFCLFSRN